LSGAYHCMLLRKENMFWSNFPKKSFLKKKYFRLLRRGLSKKWFNFTAQMRFFHFLSKYMTAKKCNFEISVIISFTRVLHPFWLPQFFILETFCWNIYWSIQIWLLQSVEIIEMFCHSDFTWNHDGDLRSYKNDIFCNFGGSEFWYLVIFSLHKMLKLIKINIQSL